MDQTQIRYIIFPNDGLTEDKTDLTYIILQICLLNDSTVLRQLWMLLLKDSADSHIKYINYIIIYFIFP